MDWEDHLAVAAAAVVVAAVVVAAAVVVVDVVAAVAVAAAVAAGEAYSIHWETRAWEEFAIVRQARHVCRWLPDQLLGLVGLDCCSY